MDFLRRKLRGFFAKAGKPEKRRELTRFEGYFEMCYKVLSWEDVSLTLTVFLVLNFVFCLVVQLQLRLFGVVFLLGIAAFVADTFFEHTSYGAMEVTHLEVIDELKNDLADLVLSLKALRKDNPSSFCIAMSVLFLTVSFVARSISGYVIVYLLLLAVFFAPLGLSRLPPSYLAAVKNFIRSVASERGVLAEDELIPFISNKHFNRDDTDLDSLLTDKTADSVTSSLISGLNSMPSHLDGEDKESLDEEDLLPAGNQGAISYTPGEISTDSDSDNKPIRFESGHFNGDSSSEEEAVYAKNLTFANDDAAAKEVVTGLMNVAAVGDNIIQMIRNAVASPSARKDSSSDSEFEIINSEEAEEH